MKTNGSSKNNSPPSIGGNEKVSVQSNIVKITELEKKEREKRTAGEKVAELIAAFCGSMTFVYVHVIWFGAWIIINSGFPNLAFDPFPYTFLTLVVSLEAIFLSTFILISQNHETLLTERRNHLDLQINMLAEQESTETLQLLQRIAKKLEIDCDEEAKDLTETIDPADLVEKISDATDDGSAAGK